MENQQKKVTFAAKSEVNFYEDIIQLVETIFAD